MKELSKILNQDSRFLLKMGNKDGLYVNTTNCRSRGILSYDPSFPMGARDHHFIEITWDSKYMVTSYFKPFYHDFKIKSHFATSAFKRIVNGKIKSSRLLELEEVANYIIQLELVDKAIVEHFKRDQSEQTLDEINEALTVEYILNFKPL